MKSHIFYKILLLALVIIPFSGVRSQVTVGNDKAPVDGAILQLKDREPGSDNVTAKNGGLLLPKVELVKLSSLEPMIDIASVPSGEQLLLQNKLHTGLIVYNTHMSEQDNLEEGIYYWDGQKWLLIYKGAVLYTSPWYKVGASVSSQNNDDPSYLNAKAVVNKTGNESENQPANSASTLTVYGNDAMINGIRVGLGNEKVKSNTLFGDQALKKNTNKALNNTAVGSASLAELTTGTGNTAVGAGALSSLTTGSNNVAAGSGAGQTLVSGSNNILIGQKTLTSAPNSTDEINIANVLFGDIASRRVSIGTRLNTYDSSIPRDRAALYVHGKMKFTGGKLTTSSEAGVLRVLNNNPAEAGGNADRIIRRSKIAPRKFVFVGSKNTQNVTLSGLDAVSVTWENAGLFENKSGVLENTLEDNNSVFVVKKEGTYEISGMISYNPNALAGTPPASGSSKYTHDVPYDNHQWLAGLIVEIQTYSLQDNKWTALTNAISLWSAATLKQAKEVSVQPMAVELQAGDKIRMVIYRPNRGTASFGLNHGGTGTSAKITSLGGAVDSFTKYIKIVNL